MKQQHIDLIKLGKEEREMNVRDRHCVILVV